MDLRMILTMLAEVRRMHKREHWSREQLEAYQAKQLAKIRKYAYANSLFYRNYHRGLQDAPLQQLPTLPKATLMEHFDDLVTDRAIHFTEVFKLLNKQKAGQPYLGHYKVMATSGSTGRPGIFLFENQEWAIVAAAFTRLTQWLHIKMSPIRRLKSASMTSASPFHMSSAGSATMRLFCLT
jgi:phenylacetate-coenzyme A ligase PaaK-like adenylate-forming protein